MSEEILTPGVIEVPTEVPVAPVSSSPPQAELPFPLNLSPSIENRDGECVIHPGACVPMFEGMEKCTLLPGSCFYFGMDYPDEVPPPQDSKPVIEDPQPSKGKPMSNPHVVAPPEDGPVVDHAPVHSPVAVDTHASVGVADTPNVLGLAQNGGQIGGNTLVLAGMAILGGGAAWKFYSQFTKQNHERKMAEIEKNSSNNEENKKRCEGHALACSNSTRELQMKLDDANKKLSDYASIIDSLNKKVTEMESGMNKAIRAGKNIDDLEERIEEMEGKLKKKLKENT